MVETRKKIAIIGAGISGMTAGYLLHKEHDITMFEAGSYIGGHTNTIDVETENGTLAVDTGFIVFNDRTYPNFIKLMDLLGVESQPSEMGFSVSAEDANLEYGGSSIASLFAQKRNLVRPWYYKMLSEILRFNREAPLLLEEEDSSITLGDYLYSNKFSEEFIDFFIIPMGSAIWSTVSDRMIDFPAETFIRFFMNHGLLTVNDRPQWRVIRGGSKQYVSQLVDGFQDRIHLNSPIISVRRLDDGVRITTAAGETMSFDKVILAVHSDQALKMLADPSADEMRILSSIAYEENTAVLHTDESVLPRRKSVWSSWNYHIWSGQRDRVSLTYNMNILQRLTTDTIYNVTLNAPDRVDQDKILKTIHYSHPQFTRLSIEAQQQKHLISGVQNTYYCGAYWKYGFHEDGVNSALDVCSDFGAEL